MNIRRFFFIIGVLLAALPYDTAGMLSNNKSVRSTDLCKKLISTVLHSNYAIEHLNAFDVEGPISAVPKEVCYDIVAQLDSCDKNSIQKVSKHWNAIGSKRVPNVYNLAIRKSFNAKPEDLGFVLFCATYDKNAAVIDSLGTINVDKNHCKELSWLSNINYETEGEGGRNEYRTLSYKNLSKTDDSQQDYYLPLEIACYSGNIDKIKELLSVYADVKKHYFGKNDLISPFAVAVQKNDVKCLELFTSLLKSTPVYTDLLRAYVLVLEIALRQNKQESFEFLACNFPFKPIQFFQLTSPFYIELKKALLSDNKGDVYAVLSRLRYSKEACDDDCISFLTSTSTSPADVACYTAYISCVVNYLNKMRKEKQWDTKAEIFTNQDKDLDILIKEPLLKALNANDNDLDALKKLIGQLEETQFFYDKKQRSGMLPKIKNSLFSLHIDLLKKARQLNNKEAFFLLSCLRLAISPGDIRDECMMSLYHEYSDKVDNEKKLMKAKQSPFIIDNAYAYIAESIFG